MERLERKWWTLIAVCTAIFMLLLDITVVNVALPDMQRDLDASFAQLQWVVDAYALTLATTVLAAGSLADIFGRRRVFTMGLVLFTAASFACGIANDAGLLIAARAVQGVGGGIMFAVSLALLANAFQGRDRGTAFGIWGATTGAAVAIGPLVGGVLTEWAGWRWIFFVNIPIGVAAIVLTLMRVDESKSPHPGRVDWLGTAALTSSLFLLVYGLLQGNQEGWSSTLIRFCLIGAVVLMAVFVVIELTRRDPMLDIRLFRGAGFVGAQIAAFSISASIFAAFLYLTLYLQNVLGYSPLAAGLRFLPLSLAAFVVAAISGNLTSRVSARWLMGGGPRDHRGLAPPDGPHRRRLGLDAAAAGLRSRRHRHRAHEPGTRLDCRERRLARAVGHGVRDEQHVPAGRDRHRHRRPRCALPEHDRLEADPARRHGSGARSRRSGRLGRVPAGDCAAGPGCVRRLARLDPHDRSDRRARRCGARRRAPAGPQAAPGPGACSSE